MSELSDQLKQARKPGGIPTESQGDEKPNTMVIRKASRRRTRLRLAIVGPEGSGKTYTALAVGSALVPDAKIVLIDTEHGTASKYAPGKAGPSFDFDTIELESFEPRSYVKAIRLAVESGVGYDVLIIDSLSHAWAGKGGALEQVDMRAPRTGSSFTAWREVTPMHNELVEAILAAPFHVIATMRTKTEYAVDRSSEGKIAVRKLGLAPIQRDGMGYEFDVVGDISQDHVLTITKTRCSALDDAAIRKPGAELAATLREWLSEGAPPLTDDLRRAVSSYLQVAKDTTPALWELLKSWRVEHKYVSWAEFLSKGTEAEGQQILETTLPKEEDEKPGAP